MSYKFFIELPVLITQNNRHSPLKGTSKTRIKWLRNLIQRELRANGIAPVKLKGNLHGIVYCFQKNRYKTDADNISKPLWDSLNKVLYKDDYAIKLRYAGIAHGMVPGTIGVPRANMNVSDVNRIDSFIKSSTNEYMLYIELGTLQEKMFKYDIV